MFTIIVLGGGAAGIFAAISCAESNPEAHVIVLEKSAVLLSKVRISGGGRCNVTHACFDPKKLIQYYPRGGQELLGPFHRFQPRQTIEWFGERGVELKTEGDGRMFPVTNSSQTIIDCLLKEAKDKKVEIRIKQRVQSVTQNGLQFLLSFETGESLECDRLILATGSAPQGHQVAQQLGHTVVSPVPSLFTFNVPSSPLLDLSGISVPDAELRIEGSKLFQRGPLLITHWGFSGPAALKLSAWEARLLHEKEYRVTLFINWLPDLSTDVILEKLMTFKKLNLSMPLIKENPFALPKNLWKRLVEVCGIDGQKRLSDVSKKEWGDLVLKLHRDGYSVEGKTTYKEEFVTCGGVMLKEVNFKTMESRICKGLHFTGEVLDIDGVTGGFNFQNAWTTATIAGTSAADMLT